MASFVVWAAALVTSAVAVGLSQTSEPASKLRLPLDLAPDAVDDMYIGCEDEMERKVKEEYLMKEKSRDRNFTLAWAEAEKYYNKNWRRKKGRRPPPTLDKEQIMAVYAVTLDNPRTALDFNGAVQSQRSAYKSAFRYHSLHFLLTRALQTLNFNEPEQQRCLTGFRRVHSYFSQDVLNKEIRFGSFAAASMGRYSAAGPSGDESCFEIDTCSGADVSLYSKLGELVREVLIPPYEVFKVTKVERRSYWNKLPCEVVYTLKSTGQTLSNLNCALF